MSTLTQTSGVSTDIYGNNAAYATARSTAASYGTAAYLGQATGAFQCHRVFLKFDTSSIGTGKVIQKVNLKMVATADNSDTDFDVVIKKCDWSASDPIASADDTAYDLCLSSTADDNIWRNTSGMSTNTEYTSGDLNTTWIVKGGTTYYALMSNRDVAATEPIGPEYITLAAFDHATSAYRPTLIVEYTDAGRVFQQIIMAS